jgi:hypothetical protein
VVPWTGRFKRALFGISPAETSFARRGFRGDAAAVRGRLEDVGRFFITGYHAALQDGRPEALAARIDAEAPREFRGFAYEGAGMGLALLDTVAPWRRDRLQRLVEGPGAPHDYLIYVGAGWVLARVPVSPRKFLGRLPPTKRWLALDGYGFHEGYFRWPAAVERQRVPPRLTGYARRGFDQGLGRSLWFVDGADVSRLPGTIGAFPEARRGDLWAGLGLACAYAGGRERARIEELKRAAGRFAPQLAQGAAFAATAREQAGNPAAHTEVVCQVLCGMSAAEAAAVTVALRPETGPEDVDAPEPDFEIWRRRIQERFTEGKEGGA